MKIIRVAAATVASISCISSVAAAHGTAARGVTVTSTLAGKRVLPQRIHWRARVSSGAAAVLRVDFLIDGRIGWVEHHPPYEYGSDGNLLVTTWLAPGLHRFTVRAVASGGRTGRQTTKARVLPAPQPPAELAGTWSRTVTEGDAGTWHITIDHVGWLFDDPHGGGQNQDASYPAPGKVLIRAAIEMPVFGRYNRGGAFCNHEPDPPGRYAYTVSRDRRALTLKPMRRDCRQRLLQGRWERIR